jgi:hypothetical protein
MANRNLIERILMAFAMTFPDRKLSSEGIEIYCRLLKDIPDEFLNAAAEEILATNKFFPVIAEIREKANALQAKRRGDKTANEAWEEVAAGIREHGSCQKPEFSTELVRRSVDAMGGWYHICVEVENIETLRAQFLKMYDALLKRQREDLELLPETRLFLETSHEQKKLTKATPIKDVVGKIIKFQRAV